MIELERHIEILLLNNDCVIVPELGGFMAHHVEARYDAEEALFLPPLRTLGFNPQLNLNDSLLAQSYVEAYDISYPEAVRRIEAEVAELRQHLTAEGQYELNDIGRLFVNSEGKLEFEPCEAGILTPELYGLSSFEMQSRTASRPKVASVVRPAVKPVEQVAGRVDKAADGHAITIKLSWIRYTVAAAAALVGFLIMTKPVSNSEPSHVAMSSINLPIITKEQEPMATEFQLADELDAEVGLATAEAEAATAPVEEPVVEKAQAERPVAEKALAKKPVAEKAQPEQPVAKETVDEPEPLTGYCIVVASQVTQSNAEEFVVTLKKEGFADARVFINNKVRRVICGVYPTEAEARRQLQSVHQHQGLAEAWIYKIKP